MQNQNECCSEALGARLAQLNSLMCVIGRTLDSPDGSIYMHEAVDLMSTASQLVAECDELRKKMDVIIYQKNSKFYETHSPQK